VTKIGAEERPVAVTVTVPALTSVVFRKTIPVRANPTTSEILLEVEKIFIN
jgi:hypothetical protein